MRSSKTEVLSSRGQAAAEAGEAKSRRRKSQFCAIDRPGCLAGPGLRAVDFFVSHEVFSSGAASELSLRADYIRPRPRARPRGHGELLKLLRFYNTFVQRVAEPFPPSA